MTDGARIEAAGDGRLRIEGALDLDAVPDILTEGSALLQKGQGNNTVDLTGVTHADSAAVALLVEWLRLSRERDIELQFTGITPQMRAIIGLCDLKGVLPQGPAIL